MFLTNTCLKYHQKNIHSIHSIHSIQELFEDSVSRQHAIKVFFTLLTWNPLINTPVLRKQHETETLE